MSEAYTSPRKRPGRRDVAGVPGAPASARELRAQGRKTLRKLLDAGMRVFGERGVQAARVDDIVRAARTSHGTFYLYFANKEDLLRALAVECGDEMQLLADGLGVVTLDDDGVTELRRFLAAFVTTYRRYGPVIRARMEGDISDRDTSARGVAAFTAIANALGRRMHEAGTRGDEATVAALMAMIERFAYFRTSRRLDLDPESLLDTLTLVVYRGFFGAPVAV